LDRYKRTNIVGSVYFRYSCGSWSINHKPYLICTNPEIWYGSDFISRYRTDGQTTGMIGDVYTLGGTITGYSVLEEQRE